MNALILAAGRGTRIRSLHGERPKCLIELNNTKETILDRQIESLLHAGVRKIAIVVGYQKEQIISHVERRYRSCRHLFEFVVNTRYAETNNIYSLWLAREAMGGDGFVCLNADVVCDPRALLPALYSRAPITMIVDPAWRDETMKVVISNGSVVRMSKAIGKEEFSGTYIGITAFSEEIVGRFFDQVETLINAGEVNVFFNAAVQRLADAGVHVGYTSTADRAWAEIDDPGDLVFARLYVFPKLQRELATAA